jgi:hypothetical protein
MTREQNKQVGQHDDLDRQCYSRQHLERSEADYRDARLIFASTATMADAPTRVWNENQ